MRIGSVELFNPLILAPLAGITHMPFRLLAKEAGCGLVTSEMISANGLYYGSGETFAMISLSDAERPVAVQLFGHDPAVMADAAAKVESLGADIIDVNFGCAVRKVVRTGAGAALMKDPARAAAILSGMRAAVRIPLTVKMRSGWDPSGSQAVALSRTARDCGVDAVTIHPRTAGQRFKGCADWELIKAVKASLEIPVIGNGDVRRPEDAPAMIAKTGCDGVMVGRAAIGNPWFFRQALAAMENRPVPAVPVPERFAVMRRYAQHMAELFGEYKACRMLRSRLGWFSRGLADATHFRRRVTRIKSLEEALLLIDAYERQLQWAAED
jgi:nifR3 family TIM-barrel protein